MSRALAVIGALVLGLLGLLMSVCGGGMTIGLVFSTIQSLPRTGHRGELGGALSMLTFAVTCLVLGIALCWQAVKLIRKRPRE